MSSFKDILLHLLYAVFIFCYFYLFFFLFIYFFFILFIYFSLFWKGNHVHTPITIYPFNQIYEWLHVFDMYYRMISNVIGVKMLHSNMIKSATSVKNRQRVKRRRVEATNLKLTPGSNQPSICII